MGFFLGFLGISFCQSVGLSVCAIAYIPWNHQISQDLDSSCIECWELYSVKCFVFVLNIKLFGILLTSKAFNKDSPTYL